MPLPVLLDVAEEYLFSDYEKMIASGVSVITAKHILRIRDAYNYWMSHPSKRDRDIVERLKAYDGIGKTAAYEDLKIVKALLGSFQKTTRDYHLYRFTEGIMAAVEKAMATGNIDGLIRAWSSYAKYHRLDQNEPDETKFEITPQAFEFTDDPSVIGFTPMPGWREKAKKLKEKYGTEEVMDVDFEPIEFNEEEIFNPKTNGAKAADLPK